MIPRREPVDVHRCPLCESLNLVEAFRVKHVLDSGEYVRCSSCDLIFLRWIDPEDERTRYETGVYNVIENPHRLEFRKPIFDNILKRLARMKIGRLLDVGCGTGLFLDLAKKLGWEVYGVDLSPAACEYARETYGLDVVRGTLSGAEFADGFFDVVALNDALCHVPSPLEEMVEVHRILKAEGIVIIRTRNAFFHVGLLRLWRSLEPYLTFHCYCFTPKALWYLLRRVGFTEIDIRNSLPSSSSGPHSVPPLLTDRGMDAIKRGIYWCAEAAFHLSARALILGPSLQVYAVKEGKVAQ